MVYMLIYTKSCRLPHSFDPKLYKDSKADVRGDEVKMIEISSTKTTVFVKVCQAEFACLVVSPSL